MAFNIIIGLLFLAVVYMHYTQGFFSSSISAILAVISAVVAFSYHETVVEHLLQGKMANTAHAMVLVVLFAVIYTLLRTLFDMAVPGGLMMPASVDRVGGLIAGCIAATFSTGILVIAAEELPLGPTVLGYAKYDTMDVESTVLPVSGSQIKRGSNFDELKSNDAGRFKEADRKNFFPKILPGVDDIVVGAVGHLSESGSLQGSQPLNAVHPDFLQEAFGQRIGLQPGVAHVAMNVPGASAPAMVLKGVYTVASVRIDTTVPSGIRRTIPAVPLKTVGEKARIVMKASGPGPEKVIYGGAGTDSETGKEQLLVIVRLNFNQDAADPEDATVRMSPGSCRLVAKRFDSSTGSLEPHDYYPLGTVEASTDGAVLYVAKPDDFLFIPLTGKAADDVSGVDLLFYVDKAGFLGKDNKTINEGAFIEFKRMWREELEGQKVAPWTRGPEMGALKMQEPSPPAGPGPTTHSSP